MSQRDRSRREFRGAGVYPESLVPAFRPGDYIRTEPDGDVYEIDALSPQMGFTVFDDGVTVSGEDDSVDNEATSMEVPTDWLGQYRPIQIGTDLPADVEVRVDQGGKESPFATNKNEWGSYTRDSLTPLGYDGNATVSEDDFNLHLAELYVYEDEVPYFTFDNTTAGDETVQEWAWSGFQYRLSSVGNQPAGHVEPVPIEAIRGNR